MNNENQDKIAQALLSIATRTNQRTPYIPTGRPATPGMLQLLQKKLHNKYHRA